MKIKKKKSNVTGIEPTNERAGMISIEYVANCGCCTDFLVLDAVEFGVFVKNGSTKIRSAQRNANKANWRYTRKYGWVCGRH